MKRPRSVRDLAPKGKKRVIYLTALAAFMALVVTASGLLYYTQIEKNQYSESTQEEGDEGSGEKTLNLRPAPQFELMDSQGKPHRLEEFRGSLLLLHFWASWCPPCLVEIPQWIELAEKFKDRPIKFIAVSLDQKWKDALKILPEKSLPKNVISLLDTSEAVANKYGSFQYPETYLISPDLKVITKWVGPQNWDSPELARLLSRILTRDRTITGAGNTGGTGSSDTHVKDLNSR